MANASLNRFGYTPRVASTMKLLNHIEASLLGYCILLLALLTGVVSFYLLCQAAYIETSAALKWQISIIYFAYSMAAVAAVFSFDIAHAMKMYQRRVLRREHTTRRIRQFKRENPDLRINYHAVLEMSRRPNGKSAKAILSALKAFLTMTNIRWAMVSQDTEQTVQDYYDHCWSSNQNSTG